MAKKRTGVIREEEKKAESCCNGTKRDPMFVGMDPSFNEFGLVVLDQKANVIEQKLIKSDTKLEADERIIQLEEEFKFVPTICGLQSIYIEGPSFSSNGQFALQMGALHYYIRIFLIKKKTEFTIVTPGALKKFVTGVGNAKKELMLLKTFKKWGAEFDNNNLADAYGLARMALEDFKNGSR